MRSGARKKERLNVFQEGRMGGISWLAAIYAALIVQACADGLPADRSTSNFLSPTSAYTWSGAYVGAEVGGSFDHVNFRNDSFNTAPVLSPGYIITPRAANFGYSATSVTAGMTGGYNYQSGMFVGGVESDAAFFSQGGSVARVTNPGPSDVTPEGDTLLPVSFTERQSSSFFGTARVRAGVTPIDKVLLYVTGGAALADDGFRTSAHPVGGGSTVTAAKYQFVVAPVFGGGVEFAFADHWTAKAEYLFVQMPSVTVLYPTEPVTQRVHVFSEDRNIVRVGVNYHL